MKVVSLFDRCNIKKYSLNGNYTPGKALIVKKNSTTPARPVPQIIKRYFRG